MPQKTFVGIGAGAIQLGLWALYYRISNPDARVVLSENLPKQREMLKNGSYWINIADSESVKSYNVTGIEVYDPSDAKGRENLLGAIANATDLTTAVPGISDYEKGVAELIAEGLKRRLNENRGLAVYASENVIGAARELKKAVASFISDTTKLEQICAFVDTTIGRMGGPIDDPKLIEELGLKKLTDNASRAFLVEDFNKIIIEKIQIPAEPDFQTGFPSFDQVENIAPYEDVKLLGHNSTHFLLACLGALKGYRFMSDFVSSYGVAKDPDFIDIGRRALIEESGKMLIKKYKNTGEPIFIIGEYIAYVDDLMWRIANPILRDLVGRVGRDPGRKLGLEDGRMTKTMIQCYGEGIKPKRYALGTAAGLMFYQPGSKEMVFQGGLTVNDIEPRLNQLWGNKEFPFKKEIVNFVQEAFHYIKKWYLREKQTPLNDYLMEQRYIN